MLQHNLTIIGWASVRLVSRVLRSHMARLHTRRNVTTCLPGLALAMVLLQAYLTVETRRLYLYSEDDSV